MSRTLIPILLAALACCSFAVPIEDLDTRALQTNNFPSEFQLQQKENCNYLCGNCGCRGYYCGDECICLCNRADEDNVKCIQHMKNKSQKMAYPFEVLIQGPAGRRFVREAKDIDPLTMATYEQNERAGRSIYSIYKPTKVGKGELMAAEEEANPEVGAAAAAVSNVGGGLLPSLTAAERRKLARTKLESLRDLTSLRTNQAVKTGVLAAADLRERIQKMVGGAGTRRLGLLGTAADETVGAPAPEEPTVGAPAPADPVVAAPAPADPVVGAPAPADDPTVGMSVPTTQSSIPSLWKKLPRIAVTPATWTQDLLKRLKSPIVGSPVIVQPEHTL